MNTIANFVELYLPVFIPLFLTVISVLAGILTGRIQMSWKSLLQIHSDLVLGLFSFVIWALVTYQQTGSIDLNKDTSITLVRVVLLLFANFILLIAGLIILKNDWAEGPLFFGQVSAVKRASVANGIFLIITVVVAFAPVILATRKIPLAGTQPSRPVFAVALPYADASIAHQLGVGRWGARTFCDISTVIADSAAAAVDSAVAGFTGKPLAMQLLRPGTPTQVFADLAVVARR